MSLEVSLNDEAVDDLHADGEYLTTAEGDMNNGGKALLVADPSLTDGGDLQEKISVLTGLDIDIQTTENDVDRVRDLETVAKTVLAQESISQSDAEQINRVVGGLFEKVAGPKEFTEVPTRANLIKVKEYVGAKVTEAKLDLLARHRKLTSSTFEAAICLCEALTERLLPETIALYEELRQKSMADLEIASTTKSLMYYKKRSPNNTEPPILVDLRNFGINTSAPGESLENGDPDLPQNTEIRAFYEILQSSSFRKLVNASTMTYVDLPSVLKYSIAQDSSAPTIYYSYVELLGLFTQGQILAFLENAKIGMDKFFEDGKVFYAGVKEQIDGDLPLATIREQLSQISNFYGLVIELEKYRSVAQTFAMRAENILEAYGKVIRK